MDNEKHITKASVEELKREVRALEVKTCGEIKDLELDLGKYSGAKECECEIYSIKPEKGGLSECIKKVL